MAAGALMITGDDFGTSHAVNEAVEAQYLAGRLSQASLMMHEKCVDEALRIARRNPGLCVGLHLTLSTARRSGPSGLTDATGNFPASPAAAGWRYFWKRSLRAALEREIGDQFESFRECGLPGIYWDGHTHLHLHPTIFSLTLPVAQAHGFRAVRLLKAENTDVLGTIFYGLSLLAEKRLKKAGIQVAARTFGLRETDKMDDVAFARLLKKAENFSPVELYYHPGVDGPADAGRVPNLTTWREILQKSSAVDSEAATC